MCCALSVCLVLTRGGGGGLLAGFPIRDSVMVAHFRGATFGNEGFFTPKQGKVLVIL